MDADVAFLEPATWDRHIHARMRWLREHAPVHWSRKDGCWVVSKFEDVAYVSKHQELFTSGQGVRGIDGPKIGLIDEAEPRHGRLRNLINKGFSPRMVKKLEVAFREITTEAIDAIAARGEADFVEEVAVPLPLSLIAEMIGIRKQDRKKFHEWSDAMIRGDGNQGDPAIMAAAGQAFLAYSAYVRGIIEDRRKHPQDDLVSILVGAKDAGVLTTFDQQQDRTGLGEDQVQLANDELIMLLVILLVAGNETTRNAISGGMQLLIEHPDERKKLIEDPGLIPSACEEMVRMVSPVQTFSRTVTEDTGLRGQRLRKGERVLMLYPSANRDADAFDDPDTFRVERNPVHLGFGLGPHFCLGANLARMEMRVAFEELLRRLPDMEFADAEGAVIVPAALVRSCTRMRVRFTPEA
ncbi:MAG: cytochrome P450 [Deltaproteobacteria bacterium]|nr:cytochrome P450 [Deltaproteobacteria bacterium]